MTCSDGHTGCAELPLAVKAAWLDVARRLCNQACPTVDKVKKVAVAVRGGGEVRSPYTPALRLALGLSHIAHDAHTRTGIQPLRPPFGPCLGLS